MHDADCAGETKDLACATANREANTAHILFVLFIGLNEESDVENEPDLKQLSTQIDINRYDNGQ